MRRLLVSIAMVLTVASMSGSATASTLRVRLDPNDSPSKLDIHKVITNLRHDDVSEAQVVGSIQASRDARGLGVRPRYSRDTSTRQSRRDTPPRGWDRLRGLRLQHSIRDRAPSRDASGWQVCGMPPAARLVRSYRSSRPLPRIHVPRTPRTRQGAASRSHVCRDLRDATSTHGSSIREVQLIRDVPPSRCEPVLHRLDLSVLSAKQQSANVSVRRREIALLELAPRSTYRSPPAPLRVTAILRAATHRRSPSDEAPECHGVAQRCRQLRSHGGHATPVRCL